MKELTKLLGSIAKKYGEGSISIFSEMDKQEVKRISTGLPSLDFILGGGIPEGRIIEVFGPASSGKCHAKGTKILMFDGSFKNVEDIVDGDFLMGIDSTKRIVKKTVKGFGKLYEIKPRKGNDSFIVNGEHILSLRRTNGGPRSRHLIGTIINISVEDYLKKSNTFKHEYALYRVGIDFPEKKLSVDPYFLGVWLGDGTKDHITIHTPDKEIVEYLQKYADILDHKLSVKDINRCPGYSIVRKTNKTDNFLLTELRKLDVIYNKHIPEIFKINSRKNRLELLAGLLDTDGHMYGVKSKQFEITQVREKLANDIVYLARSLGFYASINKTRTAIKSTGFVGEAYRIYIAGNVSEIPLRIKRKKALKIFSKKNPLYTTFTVNELADGEFYGFMLDKDELYLLDSFIVNHNTSLAISILAQYQKLYPEDMVAFIDVEHAVDPEYAKKLGLDFDMVLFSQPDSAEQALGIMDSLAESGQVKAIVLDSVAKLIPRKEVDGDIGDAEMAMRARLMSQALRKITPKANQNECTCIFINQIRATMAMYGSKETCPGGQALPYDASVRIRTSSKNIDEKKGMTTMKIVKNKVGQPFRTTEIEINYGTGFDYIGDHVTAGIEKGIITKSGAFFAFDNKKWQGEDALKADIKEDEKLFDKLKYALKK